MQDQADFAQNISIAISRRKAFEMAAELGLGSAALAGGLGTGMAANPPEAGGGLPKKNYKFVYVCHLTSSQFFTPTIYGIQDACVFLGCSYQWTGSKNSVVSEMVDAMQTAIAG
jgi:simple sugar transport system substrate-binding protein